MVVRYLDETGPDAFLDFPPVDRTKWPEESVDCPKCKGHGGWNLRLNAYPLRYDCEDTPEDRHRYTHFRASCGACWGWGYLDSRDSCPHEWDSTSTKVGNCLHEWTCKLCKTTRLVDSSG